MFDQHHSRSSVEYTRPLFRYTTSTDRTFGNVSLPDLIGKGVGIAKLACI